MKEFDLEAAKAGKKVMTRDGRNVRIVCFDRNDPVKPLVVLRMNRNKREEAIFYSPDGKCSDFGSDYDLVMASDKKVYYSNVYRFAGATLLYNNLFETYEEAHSYAMAHLEHGDCPELKSVVTVKVEWEE